MIEKGLKKWWKYAGRAAADPRFLKILRLDTLSKDIAQRGPSFSTAEI